jgi:hypothetical protein
MPRLIKNIAICLGNTCLWGVRNPAFDLFGIENLLLILAGVTVVAILLPLFDPIVRNMSYQGELNLSPQ